MQESEEAADSDRSMNSHRDKCTISVTQSRSALPAMLNRLKRPVLEVKRAQVIHEHSEKAQNEVVAPRPLEKRSRYEHTQDRSPVVSGSRMTLTPALSSLSSAPQRSGNQYFPEAIAYQSPPEQQPLLFTLPCTTEINFFNPQPSRHNLLASQSLAESFLIARVLETARQRWDREQLECQNSLQSQRLQNLLVAVGNLPQAVLTESTSRQECMQHGHASLDALSRLNVLRRTTIDETLRPHSVRELLYDRQDVQFGGLGGSELIQEQHNLSAVSRAPLQRLLQQTKVENAANLRQDSMEAGIVWPTVVTFATSKPGSLASLASHQLIHVPSGSLYRTHSCVEQTDEPSARNVYLTSSATSARNGSKTQPAIF